MDLKEVALDREKSIETLETSLKVLKTVGDPTVVNEAEKIESVIKQMQKVEVPLLETYAKNLKAFDQSIVSKYGVPTARVIEFVMVLAIAAKFYLFG